MTTWFISRHQGALHWMHKNKVHFDVHIEHLDTNKINPGDMVIGSLPVNLVAKLCDMGVNYWNLSIQLPEVARGKELTANDLDKYEAKLEQYKVCLVS